MNNCIAVIYLPYLVIDIHYGNFYLPYFVVDIHMETAIKKVNATYSKQQNKKGTFMYAVDDFPARIIGNKL